MLLLTFAALTYLDSTIGGSVPDPSDRPPVAPLPAKTRLKIEIHHLLPTLVARQLSDALRTRRS